MNQEPEFSYSEPCQLLEKHLQDHAGKPLFTVTNHSLFRLLARLKAVESTLWTMKDVVGERDQLARRVEQLESNARTAESMTP